ncbi:hypothetical protein BDW69DRAFT_158806 [Aspergillus filifer]
MGSGSATVIRRPAKSELESGTGTLSFLSALAAARIKPQAVAVYPIVFSVSNHDLFCGAAFFVNELCWQSDSPAPEQPVMQRQWSMISVDPPQLENGIRLQPAVLQGRSTEIHLQPQMARFSIEICGCCCRRWTAISCPICCWISPVTYNDDVMLREVSLNRTYKLAS